MASSGTAMYTNIMEDMEQFDYGIPITNKYKSKTSYINKSKNNQSRPRYQMAAQDEQRLRSPYGISKPFDENEQEKDRKSLDLSIDSEALLAILTKLDAHNIQMAHKNCVAWFGKQMPIEHIGFLYRPIVSYDKDRKYKPTFRTKVNVNKNADNCTRFYTIREEDGMTRYIEHDSSIITKGCRLVPICEISSLWFSSKAFGMTLDCTDVIVFSGSQREEFPFQWGDSKAVPMDASSDHHQNTGDVQNGRSTSPTSSAQVQQFGSSSFGSGFVPPSEPFDH